MYFRNRGENMEIQKPEKQIEPYLVHQEDKEEQILLQKLYSEEFCSNKREIIRVIEDILWEWNKKEQIRQKRMPLKEINARIKAPRSIVEKLKRKGYELSIQNVGRLHDLIGVRAVCNYLDDIYRLREYILSYKGITIVREKDYIAFPKKSGYQSLHLILKVENEIVELQVRTAVMDYWSNLEHSIIYKKGNRADRQIGKELIKYASFLRKVDYVLLAQRIKQE